MQTRALRQVFVRGGKCRLRLLVHFMTPCLDITVIQYCCKLSTQCLSRELHYSRSRSSRAELSESVCISYNVHAASSRSVSFFQDCLLELAQQLIATNVCIGEGYRLRPLD